MAAARVFKVEFRIAIAQRARATARPCHAHPLAFGCGRRPDRGIAVDLADAEIRDSGWTK